jgi:hypothetical protein
VGDPEDGDAAHHAARSRRTGLDVVASNGRFRQSRNLDDDR